MSEKKVILTNKAPIPTSGYSQGRRFGNMLVTSGYLGTKMDGSGIVEGGFEAEVRQALNHIKAVVEANGASMATVVRVNVSLLDTGKFSAMDAIYKEYFSEPYPTRNTIGVAELWGGAQVGFDVWAYIPDEV